MAGEINFGILNTNAPMQAFNAINEGAANRRKSRLEELAAQQAEQQFSDEAAYRDAYRQTGGDSNQLLNALAQKGLYKQANELKKQQLEAEAKRVTMGKDASITGKNNTEAATKKIDFMTGMTAALAQNPSYESYVSLMQQGISAGIVSPEEAQQHMATMPRDPAQIKAKAAEANQMLMSAKERMAFAQPQPKEVNLGNRVAFIDMNPNSPTYKKEVSSSSVAMSPGESARIGLEQQRIGQSERHFQIGQANTKAQNGKAPMGYRFTTDGSLEAIPGGPADAKAQALSGNRAAGVADVDSAVATLRDAYDRLEKGGGITSTGKGAIGNLAASSSSSVVGQAVGRALGTNNQSARNDIAMTRPALLASLMKATGMSAKQMDSNAELKLWMATATDPTLDVEANRRALNSIERKYIGNAAPSGNKPAATKSGASVSNW